MVTSFPQMQISSKCFKNNDTMPLKHVCNEYGAGGENISPELSWSNSPSDTKSFALICHDPDAPIDHGWYHWFMINIPKSVHQIPEGGKIDGAKELITNFPYAGYGGPAPPVGHGKHRYIFTIYAMNCENLDVKVTEPYLIEEEIKKHAISSASITALYER